MVKWEESEKPIKKTIQPTEIDNVFDHPPKPLSSVPLIKPVPAATSGFEQFQANPWTCSLCGKTFPGPRTHTCKQPETVKMPLKSIVALIELRATLERLRAWKRFDPLDPENIKKNRREPAILEKACKDLDDIIGDKKG